MAPMLTLSSPRRRLAAAAAATIAVAAQSAHASPSARLVYVRGPGADACPGEQDLRKAVATRIGYDPFFAAAQKTVVAQVARTSTGYRARIQIVGEDGNVRGERELASSGDACAEIVNATALAVSIALDDLDEELRATAPASGAPPPAPESMEPAARAPDTSVTAPAVPERKPGPPAPSSIPTAPAPRRARVELRASAGPTVSLGTAPSAAVGGGIAGTVGYGLLGARVGLRAELPSSTPLTPSGTLTTRTLLATVAGCVRGALPFACIGAGLGSFASSSEGISRPADDGSFLGVLVTSIGLDVPLGASFYVSPVVDAGLNLTRHRVEIDGAIVFTLPAVTATAGLYLGRDFH